MCVLSDAVRFVHANAAMCRLLGYTELELLGRTPADITHPDDVAVGLAETRAVFRGEVHQFSITKRYVRKDGHVVVGALTVSGLVDEDGRTTGTLASIVDRTELTAAERVRRESDARYRELFEGAPDGICILDARGHLLEVNDTWLRMSGYTRAELIGRHPREFIFPEDHERSASAFEKLRREGGYNSFEGRVVRRDGGLLWIEVNSTGVFEDGRLVGSRDVLRDIGARKEAEEALRASEEAYRELVETISDVVYTIAMDGTIQYCSPPIVDLLGYAPTELVGRRIFEFIHPDDRPAVQERLQTGTAGTWLPMVQRVVARDGSTRWIRSMSWPIVVEGRTVALRGLMTDVTNVRALERQLQHAQRMEAVGRLAGGVAHDFNNLLTIIAGQASLLVDLSDDPELREGLTDIVEATARGAALTGQLLAFSRRQVTRPQPVPLDDALSDLAVMLQRLLGPSILVTTRLEAPSAYVLADKNQLEQVIVNLAVNAGDAMPHGGSLTIATRRADQQTPEELRRVASPRGAVVLRVTDTGCGMDDETLEHVFEPFFTTKDVGKGTGLGLSTVYGIVTQWGGLASVRSTPDRGTTVAVALPLTGPPPASAARPLEASSSPRGRETILVVEDEPLVRSLAGGLLTRKGYEILEASDGREALAMYTAHRATIALVLTDVLMPNMGGVELARRLRRLSPDLPILFMSGHTDGAWMEGLGDPPSDAFVAKPFRPSSLLGRVRRLLDG